MTLFLDACIVIYWIEARDPFHARLMARLRALRQEFPDAIFAVSRLSWLECMVKPLRDGDQALADEYRTFFEAGQLRVVELTAPVIERATALRAEHDLRTPDALQAASALELGGGGAVPHQRSAFPQSARAARGDSGVSKRSLVARVQRSGTRVHCIAMRFLPPAAMGSGA